MIEVEPGHWPMTVDTSTLPKIDEALEWIPIKYIRSGEHGRNHNYKESISRIPKESYNWIIILQEASEMVYIIFMGMNTKFKVDSHFFNAYHFIHLSLW